MSDFTDMGPEDWKQCRESVWELLGMYYRPPRDWLVTACIILTGVAWWRFGLLSYWTIAGIACALWFLHRILRVLSIRRALFDGYEMGFEAGQLSARGIPMEKYLEHVRSMKGW
jgi:hypothetical protein